MSRPWTTVAMAALGAALFLHPPTARAQDQEFNDVNGVLGAAGGDLVFTPVVPCRIIDTRIEGGRLTPGTPRDFEVAGALGGQGGAPNCGVPEGPAIAVALNFVAVAPAGNGNMRAWPFGQPVPIASVINYTTGVNIANGFVIGICDPAVALCGKDFVVRADVSGTDLVVDVMGYFTRVGPVTTTVPWSEVTGKPAGFADDVDNDTQYTGSSGVVLAGTNFTADTAFLQRRVSTTCPAGQSIRAIDVLGFAICEPDDNTVTAVGVNSGLLLSAGILSTDTTSSLQRRVGSICAAGSSMRFINADGTVGCEPDDVGTGDITEVTTAANSGLTGGVTSGIANLAVDPTDFNGVAPMVESHTAGSVFVTIGPPTTLRSVSVTVPAGAASGGYIAVIGMANVSCATCNTLGQVTTGTIGWDDLATGTGQNLKAWTAAGTGNASVVAIDQFLATAPGTYTFYLRATCIGPLTCVHENLSAVALFIPR